MILGRTPEAKTQLARAAELDPLAPVTLGSYALGLAVARQPDSAIAAAKRGVELDSTLVVTRFMLGAVYLQANRLPEAVRELETATRLDSGSTQAFGLLGYAYAKSGKTRQASDIAKSLENQVGRSSRRGGRGGAGVHRPRGPRAGADAARARGDGSGLVLLERVAGGELLRSDTGRPEVRGDRR